MLTQIQRSFLIKELISRLQHWRSPAAHTEFSPDLPTKIGFGIQRTEKGYFYLSDTLVAWCDLTNGLIARLTKNLNSIHWKCYNDLHESGVSRLDIPLHREVVTDLDGNSWEYAELISPKYDYGLNMFDKIFDRESLSLSDIDYSSNSDFVPDLGKSAITDENRENSFLLCSAYINNFVTLYGKVSEIANNNSVGLPEGIATLASFYSDSQEYFWSDIDQHPWDLSRDEILYRARFELTRFIDFISKTNILTEQRKIDLLNLMEEKWQLN